MFRDKHPLIAARSVPITLSFTDPSTNTLSPVLLDLYPRTMTTLSHAGQSITVGRSRLNTQKMPASRQPWVYSPNFHTSTYDRAQTTRRTNPRNLMSRQIRPTQPRCLFAVSTSPIPIFNPAPLHDGAPPHPISTTGQPPNHHPTATKRPWSRAHTPPTPSSGPRNPQHTTPTTRSPRRSARSPHLSTPAPNPPHPSGPANTARGSPPARRATDGNAIPTSDGGETGCPRAVDTGTKPRAAAGRRSQRTRGGTNAVGDAAPDMPTAARERERSCQRRRERRRCREATG